MIRDSSSVCDLENRSQNAETSADVLCINFDEALEKMSDIETNSEIITTLADLNECVFCLAILNLCSVEISAIPTGS